ncbi:ubiquitin conjugating enzyme [Striga asiatica]|uniref:E2 ubiquitin-conjugating enzyme n=1 Tax=Striga asiatica TaxID=4170 RepID=A0A5A7R8H3_STRAF|nr:ubiquitin conjugating enzyme [Striga asiatica]
MESPTRGSELITLNSKKRVFPGGSSSSGIKEVDGLGTAPSGKRIAASSEREEVADFSEIIDIDVEEDCQDNNGQADVKGKGKEIASNISADFSNTKIKIEITDSDESDSNMFFGEDDWIDSYYDDITFDDHSDEALQSQFDHMDLPPGVEVSFPWLQSSSPQNSTINTSNNSSLKIDSNVPSLILDLSTTSSNPKKVSKVGSKCKTGNPPENDDLRHLGKKKKTRASSSKSSSTLLGLSSSTSTKGIVTKGFFKFGSSRAPRLKDFVNDQIVETPADVCKDLDEIKRNFEAFKKFDTVEDYSDHHFANISNQVNPPKNWAKKIQQEWKILEKDLPDTIFVRVYESRMDLLRAVIVGAEGTPYHDGLFFFDVCFPRNYPNSPPKVHYHSGGLRLNPNLYCCGKVCLSLLNTWGGGKEEKWLPAVSTMLQVLVSIQGLILNAKPYFNEPGYAKMSGTKSGDARALEYNETTFIFSLRTMVYTMNRPPKHFEALVSGHFVNRARDIMVLCKAYLGGAHVGSLVPGGGGVEEVNEGEKSCCSRTFKTNLTGFIITLINAFTRTGAKDCHEFLPLANNGLGPAEAKTVGGPSGPREAKKRAGPVGSRSLKAKQKIGLNGDS